MKFTVVFFALAAVAMGELTRVPRAELGLRQTGAPKVQTGSMSTADGGVAVFDSANVNKDATNKGL